MKKKQSFNIYITVLFSALYFLVCFDLKNIIYSFAYAPMPLNNSLFDIYFVKNTGAAFSLFKDSNLMLTIFALIVLIGIIAYIIKFRNGLNFLRIQAFSLLIAGIMSNMCERILYGYVTDYIKLNFIDFPIFNAADVCINIGAFLFILIILTDKKVSNE